MSKFKGTVLEYAQIQIIKFRLEGIDYPIYKTPTVDVGYEDSSATVCGDCVGKIVTLLARAR